MNTINGKKIFVSTSFLNYVSLVFIQKMSIYTTKKHKQPNKKTPHKLKKKKNPPQNKSLTL